MSTPPTRMRLNPMRMMPAAAKLSASDARRAASFGLPGGAGVGAVLTAGGACQPSRTGPCPFVAVARASARARGQGVVGNAKR